MSDHQLTIEWINNILKPAINGFSEIKIAQKMMENNTEKYNISDKEMELFNILTKKANYAAEYSLNDALEPIHLHLQNFKYIGGNNPNEVDKELYLTLEPLITNGTINFSTDVEAGTENLIALWFERYQLLKPKK